MYSEVRGAVPDYPIAAAQKTVQRAWKDICKQSLWSFQLYEGPQWITPPAIGSGLVTTVQGSASVTVDATAAAAINAGATTYSAIIDRQFRIASGTIYNITAWNTTTTLTLDRPYGEASVTDSAYQILQVYYAAPYTDHLRFISVRDMAWFLDLYIDKTRAQIDLIDPQRSWYVFPTDVVWYRLNPITTSSTYQFQMYELWGVPQTLRNYQLYGIRSLDNILTSPTSDLPPLGGGDKMDDAVIELAKVYAYQWAEANKGGVARNTGPDWRYLMQQSMSEHKRLLRDYRRRDREMVSQFMSVHRISWANRRIPYLNTVSMTANPYGF